jgi:hypothetical protein
MIFKGRRLAAGTGFKDMLLERFGWYRRAVRGLGEARRVRGVTGEAESEGKA